MSHIEFYFDSDGAPRAKSSDKDQAVLAQFLESDIQDDPNHCSTLIESITTLDDNSMEFIGNSFALTVSGEDAALSCHATDSDETAMLDVSALISGLQGWLDFIEQP